MDYFPWAGGKGKYQEVVKPGGKEGSPAGVSHGCFWQILLLMQLTKGLEATFIKPMNVPAHQGCRLGGLIRIQKWFWLIGVRVRNQWDKLQWKKKKKYKRTLRFSKWVNLPFKSQSSNCTSHTTLPVTPLWQEETTDVWALCFYQEWAAGPAPNSQKTSPCLSLSLQPGVRLFCHIASSSV